MHSSNTNILKLLLERGANVNDKDIEGRSTITLAASKWNKTTVIFLLSNCANFFDAEDSISSVISLSMTN